MVTDEAEPPPFQPGVFGDPVYPEGKDPTVDAFLHESLDLLTRTDTPPNELLAANMRCGEVGLKVLEILDGAQGSS